VLSAAWGSIGVAIAYVLANLPRLIDLPTAIADLVDVHRAERLGEHRLFSGSIRRKAAKLDPIEALRAD